MSARQSARPRRIDDALSQLVDSLTPPLSHADLRGEYEGDAEEALAAAEERRHQKYLERSWHILNSYTSPSNDLASPSGSIAYGVNRRGSLAGGENVNNAVDLIKRKLLRENDSPEQAVRFSNLYSRLLTQPVLSQKWAILFLLYRLSSTDDYEEPGIEESVSRSPQFEPAGLNNMMYKGQRMNPGRSRVMEFSDEDGPAVSSSASQIPARAERQAALRRQQEINAEREPEPEPETSAPAARAREARTTRSRANTGVREPPPEEPKPVQSEQDSEQEQKPNVPLEEGLLRDLPFNLQGLSSSNLQFASTTILNLPPSLPVPIISLLNCLAEPCLLYRGISAFVGSTTSGLLSQSLQAALSNELRSYLGLIATLEGEIRRALASPPDANDLRSATKTGVTLKRCVVWTRDATMALRLMNLIVEEAQHKKGGQLISLIHGFSTSHGDPFVGAFAEKLLSHVTQPFYDMLRSWIYDGELSDPYKEFFVVEPESRPNIDPRRTATSVWDDKYQLDDEMVPSIITQDFAKKIFLIGKSLNFIRYGCGDSGWVEDYSKEASKELHYGDTAGLEASIDEAYKTTMARLIHLMDDKFKLFDHLRALKSYMLLGQGDFIALLMESLASNLDRPANSQYRHTLTAQLEHAIRASNAQYDSPDVLRRLDARMLEYSHGESGWDCFTLEYKVDAPVDVVITPYALTQYLKVFNFLWRIKRVEFALGSTWRRCMTGARGVLGSVDDKVGSDWKKARCVIAEMIHFVCQLQFYILFEVIEAGWDKLQASISKPGCTLDDLIEAHNEYLKSITRKGLLSSSKSSSSSSTSSSQEEDFLNQLHYILKIMLAYKDAVDGLYSFSVAEFTRRQELSAKIETRTAQGRWGLTDDDILPSSARLTRAHKDSVSSNMSPSLAAYTPNLGGDEIGSPVSLANPGDLSADDQMLASLQGRLRDLSAEFRTRLNVFLGDLAYQSNVDMRFLGVVMNFNDVYQPIRKRRSAAGGSSRDKQRARRRAAAANDGATAATEGSSTVSASKEQPARREKKPSSTGGNGNDSSSAN
ncbi:tubulin gamma complex associated family protein [Aspergillus saccharolyticus JOP 1030-1]|uniref:Spindle pole body component n=1 Tax=Aspergillus saccharolyticus JOP 1030-1 TaxID=1450539 RepID=A0A318ZYI3_9EURO|nr:spindle pole body component [Aspergillus saccharolyticus JOP 1030-1]PYH40442.1 spindle pole body component [Aspergillus saccharolyticus JOP 1030-1]